ncbi:MAG: hypothetical protein NDJ90_01530 [Oligoflexia bacterium]|nr:hypothetical protein [Oligoflexia bacterium]
MKTLKAVSIGWRLIISWRAPRQKEFASTVSFLTTREGDRIDVLDNFESSWAAVNARAGFMECYEETYDGKLCVKARSGFGDCYAKTYDAKLCVMAGSNFLDCYTHTYDPQACVDGTDDDDDCED